MVSIAVSSDDQATGLVPTLSLWRELFIPLFRANFFTLIRELIEVG